MKLILVRHGETNENKALKLMGRSPGQLSEKGKEQARATGKFLVDAGINKVYSSPLARCLDTANAIDESLQLGVTPDDLLIERDFGKMTNTTATEIDFDVLDEPTEENKHLGVEPLSVVDERQAAFLEKLLATHGDETVLVVTHNNPLRSLLAILKGVTYHDILDTYRIHNCGITIVTLSSLQDVEFTVIDDVSHLG